MLLVVAKIYKQNISLFYPQDKRSGGKKELIIGKRSSRIFSCSPLPSVHLSCVTRRQEELIHPKR
jgi:hypothetical protein